MMARRIAVFAMLLLISASGLGQGFRQGEKTFSLNGSGSSDDGWVNNTFSIEAALGYLFADNTEIAIRQGFALADVPGSDDEWLASTRIALDWHFGYGSVVPFIGVNGGFIYGDLVDDTCFYGPEAGLRWFVNETTYLLFMAEYQCFEDSGGAFGSARYVYTTGLGFKF